MKTKLINSTLFIIALCMVCLHSCKCNKDKCGENKVWNKSSKTCDCDEYSSAKSDGTCEYRGYKLESDKSYAYPITTTCNDWRSNLVLEFGSIDIDTDFTNQEKWNVIAGLYIKSDKVNTRATFVDLATPFGTKYATKDSLITLLQILTVENNKSNLKFAYARWSANHSRDTFHFSISDYSDGNTPHIIDTCRITFVKK